MINFELICIKWVSFFCLWISTSLSTICWKGYLSFHHWTAFASSSEISYLSLYRFIFGFSILSCWSLCLFHHQYHSVLIFGAPKNWCFWTVLLEKTLESPLDCKEMQPVHSKGDQSWVFFGRNDAKAETPILWPPHAKSWLIGKDSEAGRDWGAGGDGDHRGWDGWMASATQWTWVWVNSGSCWWTGIPGLLQSTGSQRVGHDWATKLNWILSNLDFIEFVRISSLLFSGRDCVELVFL